MFFTFRRYCAALLWSMVALTTVVAAARGQTEVASPKKDLQRKFNAAYEKAEFPRAVEIGLKLTTLDPKDSLAAYDLARAYARNDDKAKALEWFKRCGDNGFIEIKMALDEPALDTIRSEQIYLDTLEVIRKKRREAYEQFKKDVAKNEPLVIVPPDYDSSSVAPLLVVLHGEGSSAAEWAKIWKESAAKMGAVLVAPQAFRPTDEGGLGWGETYEDAHRAVYITKQALDYAVGKYDIHPRNRILAGFSQGGAVALTTGYRYPFDVGGVIAIAAPYNPDIARAPSPLRSPTPKYYLMVGDKDEALKDSRKID